MWINSKNLNAYNIYIHLYILTHKHIKSNHIKLLIFGLFGPRKIIILCGLMQCFSKCGLWTTNSSSAWELVKNASSQIPPQIYCIRNWGWDLAIYGITKPPVIRIPTNIWEPLVNVFIEQLLCARFCASHFFYSMNRNGHGSCPQRTYTLLERTKLWEAQISCYSF